ncbi:SDR family oxidoreductase [Sulfitobacter sp. M57]|uniref:SDR family oxidoreductase n=1 Tax=unclassified Sulfitobacter TaxID=196795 RepID=UPI0023E0D013|nr:MULTISPECIES: SDR family oxidoreductase [unclassified Sulfitobacter]MDF3415327.1 SDR family oxidoreductase [Sulfitobacter sp. KE5]MDF3422808.1 SDR family oxidoreductase [Sulfitobacter sp. KE43]MDF3433873.1 SDR family oxidoreductase [Sulfitobacter sp. KE42]MDF3459513.1 SDR family oxidoreductase [Sulfitobacter sp. S74]MDF3463412.1 SDR family oxidoreductase [Sulfitobacter sp. Ks18]
MDMQNKTVMITGASRGIGAEAARVFAGAGANVALLARSQDALDGLVAEIGEAAIAIPCDVANYGDMASAVEKTVQAFGGLDVLINNAGVIEPVAHLAEADAEAWGQVIDINLKGVFNGMRAALPVMKGNGGGSILTISSGAAHGPVEAWSHYCASKAAVHMLTKCVHLEEAAQGIRAIGLSPGTVATQMQREIKASGINPVSKLAWEDHVPADWPAKCLLWMCSPEADGFAGEEISLRDEGIRRAVGLT